VATLVFDSLVDEGAPPSDHWLRFEHRRVQVEVHVAAEADATTLTGSVAPAVAERVELQLEDVEVSLVSDAPGGRLQFEQVPHGLVRLWLIGVPETPAIRTDWFRV
jgi:hypothetical protein